MNYLIAHLLGDFIIQNDWMANGKKGSNFVCLIHCLTYAIPFIFIGTSMLQIALILCQHYAQDRYNFVLWFMKITGKEEFATLPMAPWSIIIVDNIFHISFIYFVINNF